MLHKLHRYSAIVIGIFIVFHLINHLFFVLGVQQHIEVMELFRGAYRNIIVETLLLSCVVFQVVSGLYFVWQRRGQRRGFLEKAQALSGLYLAYFLINHVGAVFFGRHFLGLDTNIYYGIAGMHVFPFLLYFIPYYFFAVVAIFIHIAAAFDWLLRKTVADAVRKKISYICILAGIGLSTVLVLSFSGVLVGIEIPAEYRAFYD